MGFFEGCDEIKKNLGTLNGNFVKEGGDFLYCGFPKLWEIFFNEKLTFKEKPMMVIKEIQKEVVWVDYMDTEIMETMLKMEGDVSPSLIDENHKAFKDPLHVPVGPITKARSKKIK